MKTIKQFIFIISAALLVISSSCIDEVRVKGNGIEATEGRIVSEFTKVYSSGAFDVHITKGNTFEVIVSADENVIPYIETYVSNGVLKLGTSGTLSIKNQLPMEIFITTPNLEGIKLSGSGTISSDYFLSHKMDVLLSGSGTINTAFESENANVTISGSGKVILSGFTDKANFIISGSGKIDAAELLCTDCYTTTSGSGDIWISIDQYLKAIISGSGNVYYYGKPTIEKHISGSGNVMNQS